MSGRGATGVPVEIPATLAGERVDRVVALLSGRSRAEVAAAIAEGRVDLDGRPVASRHRRVAEGERLAFDLGDAPTARDVVPVAEAMALVVVHEDADLIVVDKPAGLVVHPGAGHRSGTLVAGLLARYPDLAEVRPGPGWDLARPGIVHRLDKDTSGLLAVARHPAALAVLARQLRDRSMGRTYTALVRGRVEADEGTIEAPIGRSEREPTRMAVREDGRFARTHYRVRQRFEAPIGATLLEVRLETGRTHQIRVHAAAIGHPVLGDSRYGGRRSRLELDRPFLHAARLHLVHPTSGDELELTSPLPGDLADALGGFS